MTQWVLLLYMTFGNGEPPAVIPVQSLAECYQTIARSPPPARGFCLTNERPGRAGR